MPDHTTPATIPSTPATEPRTTATVVRLIPDFEDELTAAMERLEEFLLLIDTWVDQPPHDAPPSPIGDSTALTALRRIAAAIRPTQARKGPRILGPDGHYEHLPLRPAHIQVNDLTAWADSVCLLQHASATDAYGLLAEAIETFDSAALDWGHLSRSTVVEADRLNRVLSTDPTDQTRPVWDRLSNLTAPDTVLTPRQEAAHQLLADQVSAAWHGNDPIGRWLF